MNAFTHYPWAERFTTELDREFPSYLTVFDTPRSPIVLKENDTHFIYCYEGPVLVEIQGRWNKTMMMESGYYMSVPSNCHIKTGKGIVISKEKYSGFFQYGGPIEHEGRLKYIDGCTDSLLLSPVRMGDPCLNLLYFPPEIDQTTHTHPSDRIGMILSGKGLCHAWNDGEEKQILLEEGTIFCIHANGKHKFSTPYGQDMRVLAYHPESDFGPTDEDHPMINRTIVDGVSASQIEEIRTK